MKMNKRYIHLMLGTLLMASCSSQSDVLPDAQNDDASIIHVGQVSVANMLGSAAPNAVAMAPRSFFNL